MVYSAQMADLIPPRSRSVTAAAVLVIITGCFWLAISGLLLWGDFHLGGNPGIWQKLIVASFSFVLCCMSVATVIVGFGVLSRRNWGRILAIALAGPWIFFGWWILRPLLRLPASVSPPRGIIAVDAFPIVAAIAWLALLAGKKPRKEFLPPVIVQIYVKLLDEGPPTSRPTQALDLGNGLFELLPATGNAPDVEHWEFRPGSIVRGKEAHRDGKTYLLAGSFGS
jgi:hypothetical protein